jgi:hypothetical protein
MNTMTLAIARRFLVIALIGFASVQEAMSDDSGGKGVTAAATPGAKLPAKLSGMWSFTNRSGQDFTDVWSVDRISEAPDGSLRGELSFTGRACNASGSQMTGKREEASITFFANIGRCGKGTFVLRKSEKHMFEGTFDIEWAPNSGGVSTIYLDPSP